MSDRIFPEQVTLAFDKDGNLWDDSFRGDKTQEYIRADLAPKPDTYEAILNDELKRRTIAPTQTPDLEPPLSSEDIIAANIFTVLLGANLHRAEPETLENIAAMALNGRDAFLAARKEKPL